jgi:hypothetical protein
MKCWFISPLFRQMDVYPYVTLGADGWFRYDGLHRPSFPTLLRTCCTDLVTRGFPRTMVALTVSSGWGAVWSMWTFRLTPLTRLWRLSLPRLETTTLTILWRGLLTRPSQSSVSVTCRSSATPPSPCSPFEMRATWCGVSAHYFRLNHFRIQFVDNEFKKII